MRTAILAGTVVAVALVSAPVQGLYRAGDGGGTRSVALESAEPSSDGALTNGEGPSVTTTVPFFAPHRRTIHGGFEQTILWQVDGGEPTGFDVEYSLDGGATFSPIATDLPADRRQVFWVVPEDARSNRGVVRVTAHFDDGSAASDDSDMPLHLRPGTGPVIRAVEFDPARGGDIVLKGRFDADIPSIEIDGATGFSSSVSAKDVEGNTTRKVFGFVGDVDQVFPRGVEVTVRVVNPRTGVATPEFHVTRP